MLALLIVACVGTTACDRSSAVPASTPRDGMVSFAGGKATIGSAAGLPAEGPPFETTVAPFWMDTHPVTGADFRRFVDASGYITHAQRVGSATVFDVASGEWALVDGADWRRPLGPVAPAAADDHPVTHVSWSDASAYCAWAVKRLPTEIEWEYAARNGRSGGPHYAWGEQLVVRGQYMANTWQGHFPVSNTAADGYLYTAPVGVFGRTAAGLSDMGGNVWQWCQDWFRPYHLRDQPFEPTATSEKVIRGGSFLCDPKVCHGYRVSARSHATPDSGLMHVGFRCAQDAPASSGTDLRVP